MEKEKKGRRADLSAFKLVGIEEGSKEYNDLVEELEEAKNAPPIYSDEDGDVDTTDAVFIQLDASNLKNSNLTEYKFLLDFWLDCSRICALRLFTHPGSRGEGALVSVEGEELKRNSFLLKVARKAIKQYNLVTKYSKLKLERLTKVNHANWCGMYYYMTFTASEEDTGCVGTYQAAVRENMLGLFRDYDKDKILAILSIKGGEEDLAAKKKVVTDARPGLQS